MLCDGQLAKCRSALPGLQLACGRQIKRSTPRPVRKPYRYSAAAASSSSDETRLALQTIAFADVPVSREVLNAASLAPLAELTAVAAAVRDRGENSHLVTPNGFIKFYKIL